MRDLFELSAGRNFGVEQMHARFGPEFEPVSYSRREGGVARLQRALKSTCVRARAIVTLQETHRRRAERITPYLWTPSTEQKSEAGGLGGCGFEPSFFTLERQPDATAARRAPRHLAPDTTAAAGFISQ